jgi:hypothetical protein
MFYKNNYISSQHWWGLALMTFAEKLSPSGGLRGKVMVWTKDCDIVLCTKMSG